VRIGKHAIIGAGGVVLEDIPDYQVAAGVPTKLLRDRRSGAGGGRDGNDVEKKG
jgi:acetyltransferase-like isoleucine patch superfamily enzyme